MNSGGLHYLTIRKDEIGKLSARAFFAQKAIKIVSGTCPENDGFCSTIRIRNCEFTQPLRSWPR
jgi:hypothetical protein